MPKSVVDVTNTVEIEISADFFTPEFMAEFRQSFYNFTTIEQHFEHLAQLYARGLIEGYSFVEGYGYLPDLGFKFTSLGITTTAEEPK